jgi:transcriptional regulator with XRE-family HTH domain
MDAPATDLEAEAAGRYAEELRRWREQRGLSKRALAQRMAYDRTYVSHIEGGHFQPTEDFTRRAEKALATGGVLWSCWQSYAVARSLRERRASPPTTTMPCGPPSSSPGLLIARALATNSRTTPSAP